jgi:glucose-1-phosphate cytidylyltransferase
MKAVILAGGFGTRISEESGIRPKPMVEIGGKPILWHIMKIYYQHGIDEFIICCGYKGYMIKEYFSNYFMHMSDVTFDMEHNKMEVHHHKAEKWKVSLIDTGEDSMTGGRIKRVKDYIGNETFCLTYGDGLSNVDIRKSIEFHKSQNSLVTLTAVQQRGRFGVFSLSSGQNYVDSFKEKPKSDGHDDAWINGGFFVVEPEALNYIDGDQTVWEREPLETFAEMGKLSAFRHKGFWFPMDTLRDKNVLDDMWKSGQAEWKIW